MHTYNPKPGGWGICGTCGREMEWHVMQSYAIIAALRDSLREALTLSATSDTKCPAKQTRLLSYHVLPKHLQIGDRFADENGEWEIATRPCWTAGGKSVHASVRRVDQPVSVQERTWIAQERISVRAGYQEPRPSARD